MFNRTVAAVLAVAIATSGCTLHRYDKLAKRFKPRCEEPALPACGPGQLRVEEPCPDGCLEEGRVIPVSPNEVADGAETTYMDLSLEQAVAIAMERSTVLRDLGVAVLSRPSAVRSIHDPALAYTDPNSGEEAALSAFDAQFAASAIFNENDRALNNTFLGTAGILTEDQHAYNVEINKRAATGTQIAVRNGTDYLFDNSIGNRFGLPSGSWTTFFEGEVRQPLLQGAGLTFNRIAGPGALPGQYNGVLIARVRSDVSVAEYEAAVRDLVSNVENAYWDLYFSYYDLDAKKRARDKSLELWVRVQKESEAGRKGEIDTSQAIEQYWRFESDVRDAVRGRLTSRTATGNGSSGGTFTSLTGGVRTSERRLRLILGLPINSVQLIRPTSYPPAAPVEFDWDLCANEALAQRAELRRQRWIVKQQELELIASRNFLSPQLDVIGRYRFRGFGETLLSQSDAQFDNAFADLATGDFQEWEAGVELSVPLGFRRAHAGVRNAELRLARERAILTEQERAVMFGLSNSFDECRRAYEVFEAAWNQKGAADRQVTILTTSYTDRGDVEIDVVLEAERRAVQANIAFHRASVDYALSIRNIHFEKGTLLEYNGVRLAESASHPEAYGQARRTHETRELNYVSRDLTISRGPAFEGLTPTVGTPYTSMAPVQLPTPVAEGEVLDGEASIDVEADYGAGEVIWSAEEVGAAGQSTEAP